MFAVEMEMKRKPRNKPPVSIQQTAQDEWTLRQPCCSCGTRRNVIIVDGLPMCDGRQLDSHWLSGCADQLLRRHGRFGADQYDARHLSEWVDRQRVLLVGRYEEDPMWGPSAVSF